MTIVQNTFIPPSWFKHNVSLVYQVAKMISLPITDLFLWGLVSFLIYYLMIRKSRRDKLLDVFPGPPRPPIIGHSFDFLLTPKEQLFPMLIRWCETYGPVVKTFSGGMRFLMVWEPKYVEKLLTSTVHTVKGRDYEFLRPWLGDGLLISTGPKWSHRRKQLTPSFHFKILEDFMPIFNSESFKFVDILARKYGGGGEFDIVPFVAKCTLDIICETAMGKPINAQGDENLEYSHAIREFGETMQNRAFRPWLRFEFLWKRSALFARQEELLRVLHGFTDTVIKEKKLDRALAKKREDKPVNDDDSVYFGTAKKKKAFLDLLLDVQDEVGDTELTDQNIREETDTFMFAGHDTTSVGISFTAYVLGAYPEVQRKVREEIEGIFGGDKERDVTVEDLSRMKYLECVVKETLRVYPSVPFIQRYLTEEFKLDENVVIPADVTVAVFIYQLHKHPEYFPEPHEFRPERFSEGGRGSAFAYVPFSAGPRNCIGQKFALMEWKVIVANLVRNFRIESVTRPEDMVIQAEITVRCSEGIRVRLVRV